MKSLSKDVLDRVVGESEMGVVVTDLDGNILEVSERTCEITGYSARELVTRNPRVFQSGVTPNSVYERLWKNLRLGQPWKGRLLNRRKNGTMFLDRESILPCQLENGARRFVATHLDADVEMELRLKIQRSGHSPDDSQEDVQKARARIASMDPAQLASIAGTLSLALEARDNGTAGHGRRTAELADVVGATLGIFEHCSRQNVRLGAILHDFGKIGIPDSILLKAGILTPQEYEVMKTHPVIGFDILQACLPGKESLRIVRHHHERLDGSGYPDGLRGIEIPDYVKVVSVCDVFDAMTSPRSYRPAMSPADALSIMTDDALGGLLDMSAVRALKKLLQAGALDDILSLEVAA